MGGGTVGQVLGYHSNNPPYRCLFTVLHELCQVEQRLSDLGDVGDGQGQLEVGH